MNWLCSSGDVQYKPFVSSEAEVLEVKLDGTEEYLVLACDGLWDTVTSEELPRLVFNYMTESGGSASGLAKYLVQYAKDNDSMDNISVIVIVFREDLTEPVADAGFFNFFSGRDGSNTNSQGSNSPGKDAGDNTKSGADNHNSGDTTGDRSGGDSNADSTGNSNGSQNDVRKTAGFISGERRTYGDISMNNENLNSQDRGLRETTKPELLININHMSFDIGPQIVRPTNKDDSDSVDNSTEADVTTETETGDSFKREDTTETGTGDSWKREDDSWDSSRKDSDLDCYGVFNTRLMDGPIDLSCIDDANSSALLKNIADNVYNITPQNESNQQVLRLNNQHVFIADFDRDIENSLHNYLSTEPFLLKKKTKKSKNDSQRSKKAGQGKEKHPVCWAFTGKNKATVQNYKLNMAAKTFNKGSNQLSGDNIPKVIAPPSKFAQNYSATENVHDIANITLNPGKLEKLPTPRPKVLPGNLAKLSGMTVFGSKSYQQKESQKFHTTWRPRKPLKPISSIVYESPPTPFLNNKL